MSVWTFDQYVVSTTGATIDKINPSRNVHFTDRTVLIINIYKQNPLVVNVLRLDVAQYLLMY